MKRQKKDIWAEYLFMYELAKRLGRSREVSRNIAQLYISHLRHKKTSFLSWAPGKDF